MPRGVCGSTPTIAQPAPAWKVVAIRSSRPAFILSRHKANDADLTLTDICVGRIATAHAHTTSPYSRRILKICDAAARGTSRRPASPSRRTSRSHSRRRGRRPSVSTSCCVPVAEARPRPLCRTLRTRP
jgi:hypothetical protein